MESRGHIAGVRAQATRCFFSLIDQDKQFVFEYKSDEDKKLCSELCLETYVKVTADPATHPKRGTVEWHVTSLVIISKADSDFLSLMPEEASEELTRERRGLFLRTDRGRLIVTLHSKLLQAIREACYAESMIEVTPSSFARSCEGGSDLFKVKDYPGLEDQEVCLTQSSQFALEVVLAGCKKPTFCISPSFRAEKSHTRRHLTEFLHFEVEWPDVTTIEEHIHHLSTITLTICKNFQRLAHQELIKFECLKRVQKICTGKSCTLSHHDAIDYLRKQGITKDDKEGGTEYQYEDDIPERHERKIIDMIAVERDVTLVYLTHFPLATKSFYMKTDPTDSFYSLSVDVEAPAVDGTGGVGEIIGSGIRENNYDELVRKIKDRGLKVEDFTAILETRKYGHMNTSGFGLGVDRFLCWLLGIEHIRDVVTFPSHAGHVSFV